MVNAKNSKLLSMENNSFKLFEGKKRLFAGLFSMNKVVTLKWEAGSDI